MPTFLRLIILLGEVIGFLAYTIIRIIMAYRRDKKIKDKSEIILAIICNVVIIIGFIFGCFQLTFLSYNKIIFISSFIIFILSFKFGLTIFDKHDNIGALLGIIGFLGSLTICITIIVSFFTNSSDLIQIKTCINEESSIETINPEIGLTDKSKIGYTLDESGEVDSYIFFYKDNRDNWCKVDESIENVIELSDDNSSYVEKNVIIKTILDHELDESDDNYISKEIITTYILYYNPKELIEITD